jgi:hypothetical protein
MTALIEQEGDYHDELAKIFDDDSILGTYQMIKLFDSMGLKICEVFFIILNIPKI